MKFDNLNIWLTEKCDPGRILKEIGYTDVYGNPQAHIYYDNGIPEFDKIISSENYISQGYICNLMACESEFSLFFVKLKGDEIRDLGVARINRKNIISFDEIDQTNLKVVKEEETKHKRKSNIKTGIKMAFGGSGLLGDIVINAINKTGGTSINANTEFVNGAQFILKYHNSIGDVNSLVLYSSEKSRHKVQLFLNTYYKSELPIQALNSPSTTSTNCFIATACYRDLYSPEVVILREFRDKVLSEYFFGRLFIKFYYLTSPLIYDSLLSRPKFSNRVKIVLDKLLKLIS